MEETIRRTKKRPTLWRSSINTGSNVAALKQSIARHVQSSLGRDEYSATPRDRYQALSLSVRDFLIERWINTQQTYYLEDVRRVYYLSMEYLMGRALRNAVVNLGLLAEYGQALTEMGHSFEEYEDVDFDAGLGNGGLGRLAACFLDSMATLQLPACGYGLRYDHGIFRQEIHKGHQVEEPDDWLRLPNPWEIARPEYNVKIQFGGRLQVYADERGRLRHRWVDTEDVVATAYDTPIPGYGNNTVNTLRLWQARGSAAFGLEDFNVGDYIGAVEHKVLAENITKILYPNDNVYSGKELRLRQQYLLVSATLQDALRRHLVNHPSLDDLHEKAVFQLNDTHPALAVAELMRLLVDDHGYEWSQAWEITGRSMAYTNHTLLPEALERWPVDMLQRLLPRHLAIINDINAQLLKLVRKQFPDEPDLLGRMSIYEEGDPKKVRMAHLAVVGSFSVNSVAELHTELLKSRVLPDFHRLWPERFNNKTNGVTQRRWLASCNPALSEVITRRIGAGWITDLMALEGLTALIEDRALLDEVAEAKLYNKLRLAEHVKRQFGFEIDPNSIFDVHIKRIHEYKRQLLNILHIIHLYLVIKRNREHYQVPRTFIFGGKAAPGYAMAKLIIKLINNVAERVNRDDQVSPHLRVFFYPNYGVSVGELLFPAADVSEQISTAGFEASGTGNMKFALNGAVTVGTLDGANIEIAREVGKDNIFVFGLTVDEVAKLRQGGYAPRDHYYGNKSVREVVDLLAGDYFSPSETGIFQPLVDHLMHSDYYLSLADFDSYRRAHLDIDVVYANRGRWNRMALINIAKMGPFSSDRTIQEYVRDVWKVPPCPVEIFR